MEGSSKLWIRITSRGPSSTVPVYLLRTRWGGNGGVCLTGLVLITALFIDLSLPWKLPTRQKE